MSEPTPVYLQHMPADVARELDRLMGVVLANGGSGHVSAHLNDSEVVKYDHRAVAKRERVKVGR